MVLSRYLKILPHPEKPGWSIVFSTRKASLCLLPDWILNGLEAGEVPDRLADTLRELAVLVPDAEAERDEALGFLDEVNRADPGLTLAVILGMGCNFACPYCYENPVKSSQKMSDETVEALVAFVKERFAPGKRQLLLDLYGGETLLYRPAIRRIVEGLKPFCDGRGAYFGVHLVTNGSLLTPEVVDELLPLGLAGARVTLDGPAEIHDRLRPFRDGRGSFEAILANLRAVAGRLKVSVGSNYTGETWRHYPRLLDRLEAEGLGPERLALVHFAPVSRSNAGAMPAYQHGCASVNEPWVAEAAVTLREEVLRRGYRISKIAPSPCMIDLENAFTVSWDGSLYKCPGPVGRTEFAVGDLWRGFSDYRSSHGMQEWRRDSACRACVYLPLCLGGCRFQRLQREGSLLGTDCQKPFLDATLAPMLLQDLKYRHPCA